MWGILAVLSVLCAAPAVPSVPIPTQLLVGAGATETPLGEDARRSLGPRLKTLLESCSIDSVNERSVFAKRDAEADWADILRGPHLRARFDPPLLVHRWDRPGQIAVAELAMTLHGGPYWLTRDGAALVEHTKCAGLRDLEITCSPWLRPYVSERDLKNCSIVAPKL